MHQQAPQITTTTLYPEMPTEYSSINSVQQPNYRTYTPIEHQPLLISLPSQNHPPLLSSSKTRILSHNKQYVIVAMATICTVILSILVCSLFIIPMLIGVSALEKKIECKRMEHQREYTNLTKVDWNQVNKVTVLLDNGSVHVSQSKERQEQIQLIVKKRAAKKKYLYAVEEHFAFHNGEIIIANQFASKECKVKCYASAYEIVLPKYSTHLQLSIQSSLSVKVSSLQVEQLQIISKNNIKVKDCFIKEELYLLTTGKGSQKVSNTTASVITTYSNRDATIQNVTLMGDKKINCTTLSKGEVELKQMIGIEQIYVNTTAGDISIDLSSTLFRGKYEIANQKGKVQVEEKGHHLPTNKGTIGTHSSMQGYIAIKTIKGDVELESK